ncbi:MAG: single-stranded-DNA-specific exonuclease RecJ [Candidatus Omnitrophota bacterium]
MNAHKILKIASPEPSLQDTLSSSLGISKTFSQVLINRGIRGAGEARRFLDADVGGLSDPYSFRDMPKAVDIISKAIADKKKVMVFGDYDVDGITAIAILDIVLRRLGADVLHYIPHRIKEGYGLTKNILRLAEDRGAGVLITVDCGINSPREVEALERRNIRVILTDHHEPASSGELPAASAIINPKVKGSVYPYRDLAGVGVAYKLCQALSGGDLNDCLDIVALGTVADVVPLTGENRILVKEGLKRLKDTANLGLQALMESSGIKGKNISPTFVSYILGPRINASGRMDSAEVALELLLSSDRARATELASLLEGYNRQRQKVESSILEEAQAIIDKEVNFKEHKIIVIAKEDWHQGVLGIVASKLADRFYRPTILISLNEELCKGSGRSIKNFHLFDALADCSKYLDSFGGHSHAVGLLISRDNIADFRHSINRLAREKLLLQDLLPSIEVDMELGFCDLNERLADELKLLEPLGAANPKPLFYSRNLNLKNAPQALGRDTLKFWVTDGNITYQAIGFGMASLSGELVRTSAFDLIYTPRMDSWRGGNSLILEVEDIFFK